MTNEELEKLAYKWIERDCEVTTKEWANIRAGVALLAKKARAWDDMYKSIRGTHFRKDRELMDHFLRKQEPTPKSKLDELEEWVNENTLPFGGAGGGQRSDTLISKEMLLDEIRRLKAEGEE